jgi:hypothetical protein|tara:strand:- start:142 stop:348 length:207 start_codon:yes stop_codon:yes gene_type:complete
MIFIFEVAHFLIVAVSVADFYQDLHSQPDLGLSFYQRPLILILCTKMALNWQSHPQCKRWHSKGTVRR